MRKSSLELFTDDLHKQPSHDDYIDFDTHGLYDFSYGMTPDFLADDVPEDMPPDNVYGFEEYKAMREAEKAAADVAMRLYKMRGNVSKRYAQFTAIFINLTKEGRAVGQWQIDSIVVEYRKLLMVYIGAQKHNIDVVDFIDMVLYELAQIAMRGAA